MHLSDINALHDEGMRLLIELHAWAETADEGLNLRIWEFLSEHTERHKFELLG